MNSYEGADGKVSSLKFPVSSADHLNRKSPSLKLGDAEREEKLIHLITMRARNINHQHNDRALTLNCHQKFSAMVPKWKLIYDWPVIITLKGCSAPEQLTVHFRRTVFQGYP